MVKGKRGNWGQIQKTKEKNISSDNGKESETMTALEKLEGESIRAKKNRIYEKLRGQE